MYLIPIIKAIMIKIIPIKLHDPSIKWIMNLQKEKSGLASEYGIVRVYFRGSLEAPIHKTCSHFRDQVSEYTEQAPHTM